MTKTFPKRFFKTVTTEPAEAGHIVCLDGRAVKTPGKQPLIMARADHAKLIAEEWDAQSEQINPANMPLTRLMNVAVERTPNRRGALINEARRYGGTDLLCYRAEAPAGLTARQADLWDPWLSWAAQRGISLKPTQGIVAITQDEQALSLIEEMCGQLDDVALTLLVHLTAVYGSVILALAVMQGDLEAGAAYDLSRLDALYQAERWGEDEEAASLAAATRKETLILAQLI